MSICDDCTKKDTCKWQLYAEDAEDTISDIACFLPELLEVDLICKAKEI